jgi:predicted phosphoribosyltransferase
MSAVHRESAKIKIMSYSREPFQDRSQAGVLLAAELSSLRGKKAVVLGIPRGGILVAQALARGIDADLDIVLSRKLGTPGHTELAMGALAETGEVILNPGVVKELYISESDLEEEKARQMAEIERRKEIIREVLPKIRLQGRTAVVTDDGLATGATMEAAIWAVRHENPQRIIAAVPVASEEAIDRIADDVDEVLCLRLPSYFMAVGQFYIEFSQTTDEEVLAILRQEQRRKTTG